MVEIGQLAIKIAGRDGGNFCAIVDKIDDNFVLIDGNVRRKKCNIGHLEFLDKSIKIKKGVSTAEVKKELEKLGIKPVKKGAKKEKKARPLKQRKTKAKTEFPKKSKKESKKEAKK